MSDHRTAPVAHVDEVDSNTIAVRRASLCDPRIHHMLQPWMLHYADVACGGIVTGTIINDTAQCACVPRAVSTAYFRPVHVPRD